ncbi:MAG: outer membrane protein assembly factor BamD [Candidatus Aminicenantes bacterium]|jgi:outer membrane protein assembly factor BamD
MRKKLILIGAAAMMLVLITGACGKKKDISLTPEDMGSDKEIYEKAKKRIKRNPEKARLLFKEVMHLYPDSIYARRAKIGIADSYYRQKDAAAMLMAASEYQEYVNLYPNSPDAVYAKYQIAMCYIRQMKRPGRDQTNTHKAITALESMIRQYPGTNEAEEAKKQLEKARQRLATHYFNIGRTNFKMKAYMGAITRFKQVIDNYPGFEYNDRLFYFTGKCYYAMKDYTSAMSFFQKIVNSYPQSKYLKKATGMIKEIAQIKEQIEEKKKIAQRDKE